MLSGVTRAAFFLAVAASTFAASILLAAPAYAQGEHGRRAAAELRAIGGDIRRLQTENPGDKQRKGLIERLRGALAPLDLLLRLANQESKRPQKHYRQEVKQLASALQAGDLTGFMHTLNPLMDKFPLESLPEFGASTNTDASALHNKLCAHCHDNPAADVERPAYNLHKEAQTLPAEEFLSRMLIGVRGDRITGIDNPLSDDQISGLIRWYQSPTK